MKKLVLMIIVFLFGMNGNASDLSTKKVKEQSVEYYLNRNLKKGVYTMGMWGKDKTYIGTVINDSLTIKTIDSLCYAPHVPRWTIACKPTNCYNGCDKTKKRIHVLEML